MSETLYRKYRSKSLDEIVGQSHVTDVLKRSIEQGRVAHAYLLTGPRGIGKTSIARILAYAINNLPYDESNSNLDIIEIDAASNNGVEDVRSLKEKVQIAPVSVRKKIYIIDEVHMLSKAAFNALLKTLEEPPEHVIFILATTDADKLPPTIISRTQRFNLRVITPTDAIRHLRYIAKEESINVSDEALELIAQRGDGSFRDSISLLDQLRSLTPNKEEITPQAIEQMLGLAPKEFVEKLIEAYEAKKLDDIVNLLNKSEDEGIQATMLTNQLIKQLRTNVTEKPQLLPLLDQLLEVDKSSYPGIKLLTSLSSHAVAKPKSAALAVHPMEVSMPIAALRPINKQPRLPESTPQPIKTAQQTQNSQLKEDVATVTHIEKFNWTKLIDSTRQNFVGLYSVLSKCGHDVRDGQLVIYTNNGFYKRKLDDTKQRINLSTALIEIGVGNIVVETVASAPPPKDETAAAVAAIMGGGEEVTVED